MPSGAVHSLSLSTPTIFTIETKDPPSTSTLPRMHHIHTPEHPGLDQERLSVMKDIGRNLEVVKTSSVEEVFKNASTDKAAAKFLDKTDLYNTTDKRWVGITPRNPTNGEGTELTRGVLRTGMFNILTEVMSVVAAKSQLKERHIVDAHDLWIQHKRTQNGDYVRSSPDIVITGTVRDGCSFETPYDGEVGFENMVTCVEIRTAFETRSWTLKTVIAQMGTYARQVFIHQPNRISFRCLWATETHFRLFHFDRAGCQYSLSICLHEAPKLFIQVFLGLCSVKEEVIGFDTSIQFTYQDGMKTGGYIRTHDGRKLARYPLVNTKPIYTISKLLGRGVTCWLVEDRRQGRELVVKDSWEDGWEESDLPSESEMLRKAIGLTGVMQLVAFEDKRKSICTIRIPSARTRLLSVTSQWRVVTVAYGQEIGHFTSEKALFGAMRDGIAAHMTLGLDEKSTLLHRDISRRNILLGRRGADPGWRGILIDLDKSWDVDDIRTSDVTGYGVGTKIYKSISILLGGDDEKYRRFGWHDSYDDLESFFYVLIDVMLEKRLAWEGGEWMYGRKVETPELILDWSGKDEIGCAKDKMDFLSPKELDLDSIGLGYFWSPAARTLLTSFFKSVRRIHKLKSYYWVLGGDRAIDNHLELCERGKLEEYYAEILAIFDTAVEEASEHPGPSAASTPVRTPLSTANTNTPDWLAVKKRAREEACVGVTPTAKRGRTLSESDDISQDI